MSKFTVVVTKIVTVEFDPSKLDDEFWSDFNTSITDRGGPDLPYLAEHVAWNYVQGDHDFVEGVGDLTDMGVQVHEIDSSAEVEE